MAFLTIGTDRYNYDDELARVVDRTIQPSNCIERQDTSYTHSRINERDWIEMYRFQWGMFHETIKEISIG
jgi:hypothetical protein